MDVLCVGLVVCDLLVKPVHNEIMRMDSCRVESMALSPGGDAMNVACNMARLGLSTGIVGRVGRDAFGDFMRQEAASAGAHDLLIVDRADRTSVSVVLVESEGERHFVYYGNCNDNLRQSDVDDALLAGALHLHVGSAMALASLDGEPMAVLMERAKAMGLSTSLDCTSDTSGAWLPKVKAALAHVDYFMPSFDEASAIAKTSDLHEIERFFRALGIKNLVVKLGKDGCFISGEQGCMTLPICANEGVVDTTGAGDAFVSGFLSGLINGLDMKSCGVRGNYLAARCVESVGAQNKDIHPDMLAAADLYSRD